MARMVAASALDLEAEKLEKLGRVGIRRVVEAGSAAATQRMQFAIKSADHVRNGNLLRSVGPTKLYESLDGAHQFVDQQGIAPSRDITEHDIAWRIDNGPGGDGFLTKAWDDIWKAGEDGMRAEADRIFAELAQ